MSRILGRGMDSPSDNHSVEMQPSAPPRWSAGSSHARQPNAYDTIDDERSSYMYSPSNRSQRSMREPSSPPAQHSYMSGSSVAPYAYPPPPPPPQSYSPMYTAAPGGASVSPIPHDALEPAPPQVSVRAGQRAGRCCAERIGSPLLSRWSIDNTYAQVHKSRRAFAPHLTKPTSSAFQEHLQISAPLTHVLAYEDERKFL